MSYLRLDRLRVIRRGRAVYDERFHDGVNIIRGQNGSGKSTVADFIFYILGGEFDDWKEAAGLCEEVQAEVTTPKGQLTLKRSIGLKTTPISVFFGSMDDAQKQGLAGWENFPIRRQGRESFSQVMFRSMGVPEAQSEGASNITMHQLLRLCYSDQRTPSPRLFRFESFDTPGIREAVGDLICGLSGYEIYEIGLELRELTKKSEVIRTRLNGLLQALPPDDALRSTALIHTQLRELDVERSQLLGEIARVDDLIEGRDVKEYSKKRRVGQEQLVTLGKSLEVLEARVATLEFEIREVDGFQEHLTATLEKLGYAERSFLAIGNIAFTHCPACGEELGDASAPNHCVVCNRPIDTEREKSHYNKIRLDLEIQIRESKQLMLGKKKELEQTVLSLRQARQQHAKALSDFEIKFAGANGPREAFLGQRTTRIGHIEAEITYLTRSLDLAAEIDTLNEQAHELDVAIDKLKQREGLLQRKAASRREKALGEISAIAASILHDDLPGRQDEFAKAQVVKIEFQDDAILLDGKMNFAESSNVFLKNAAILSMLIAAGGDPEFFHPRFLLLDNIEDKGMEMPRTHLFQEILVTRSTELQVPYQIIFTTSMMNPKLDLTEYTIGPAYTQGERTLRLTE